MAACAEAGGCLLNYDGNYYLHYYDEEYRKEYEIRQMHHGDDTNISAMSM